MVVLDKRKLARSRVDMASNTFYPEPDQRETPALPAQVDRPY